MPRPSDTKQRIQRTARELFARQGVHRTSLQEIADRLGITKPALYYHFSSREELVRSIVQPIIDEEEAFLAAQEALPSVDPYALLDGYFDFHYRHRAEIMLMLSELTTFAELGLIEVVLAWRRRFGRLLHGTEPTLDQAARAVVAFGGIQDCTIQFPDVPQEQLRRVALDAACAALGLDPPHRS
ncbi:TetR/AcrR family transcriptional regulator [Actinocatenispora comari]|jgi:AcrR family transcriptional regulator|uniref:TetR family transcriptional regulator n=1 Tax=Actinocatenispora comari TaxID=2807577 RepID=A0A8J4AAD7_9ACTN|nr:TetR/AcrR family transcriptional regulator [Actinocatenispora comari]GIL26052.1 TetR family transcriptional regulator [Actinocatenispora comari]